MTPPHATLVLNGENLVTAAQARDSAAFGELFRLWYDRCFDVAFNIVRDREIAADVAQDTFLIAWQRLPDLQRVESFGGWILRISRNGALNWLSRNKARILEPLEEQSEDYSALLIHDEDPARLSERRARRQLVWTATRALGQRDMSLLDLHLRHGLESSEIAELLDITPNNASQLLLRLRGKLREVIGAALLWRGGRPTCPSLAALVPPGQPFSTETAATIRRHQRKCGRCLIESVRQTRPDRLFALLPIAVASTALKTKSVAALQAQGVSLNTAISLAKPPSPAAPPVHFVSTGVVAGTAALAVLLGVVTISVWPRTPGGSQPSGSREPSIAIPVIPAEDPVASAIATREVVTPTRRTKTRTSPASSAHSTKASLQPAVPSVPGSLTPTGTWPLVPTGGASTAPSTDPSEHGHRGHHGHRWSWPWHPGWHQLEFTLTW